MSVEVAAPVSDVDPYTDAALLDPWPGYRQLRAAGPVVWLPRYGMYAAVRYDAVRQVLRDAETFRSGRGVMMNDDMNMARGSFSVLRGKNALCSDGAEHARLRTAILKPLRPAALKAVNAEITDEAERLVQRLVARGSFDAVTDLAHHLPLTVVANLVGLPEPSRERMLVWASEMFNCFGPRNERMLAAVPVMEEMMGYAAEHARRDKVRPGSWAAALHDAADRGELPASALPEIVIDYVGPSLDTTIFAITSAVWLFARHPDQWALLREDPSRIPSAVNEVLRLESPVQGFSRSARTDCDVAGVPIPARSRVIAFFGAGNRDERQYPDPDTFDVLRNPTDHLAFGAGPHLCVGTGLARLEMTALFTALARRVRRFELGIVERALHNVLRGFTRLDVTVS